MQSCYYSWQYFQPWELVNWQVAVNKKKKKPTYLNPIQNQTFKLDFYHYYLALIFSCLYFRYEDHSEGKKQLTPRRRRVAYPPITPNACFKDSVASAAFDCMWQEVSWNK